MKAYLNTIIVSAILGTLTLVSLSSCEDGFLKQNPQTKLSNEQIFENPDNVQAFVYGLYYQWRATRINRKCFYTILGTDEAQQGEYQIRTNANLAAYDKYDGYYDSENTHIADAWNCRWPVVVQTSESIYHINRLMKSASASDLERYQLFLGQISFYRACLLFELTQYWGKLPLPNIVDGQNQLSSRKSLEEVYNMIVGDLNTSLSYLSEERPNDGRIPTAWAAKMLLAKVYMAAPVESGYRNFGEAKTLLEDIKARGKYVLEKNYEDLFNANKVGGNIPSQYSTEEIFTLYFNNVWPDCTESQWYIGSRACSADPNCMYGGYDLVLPTAYCVNLYEPGDQRKDANIRTDFIYKGKQPSPVAGFGEDQLAPHFKKFEDVRIDGIKSFYNTGTNMYYLRYADALLMLAECMNETGNTSEAVNLVNNTVRTRAFGGVLPTQYIWNAGMSSDEFRIKIMDERMRELVCEGWRRIDLSRTGKFEEYIKLRNRWQIAEPTVEKKHRLFPVPMVEIKQNPNLDGDQNPELN